MTSVYGLASSRTSGDPRSNAVYICQTLLLSLYRLPNAHTSLHLPAVDLHHLHLVFVDAVRRAICSLSLLLLTPHLCVHPLGLLSV